MVLTWSMAALAQQGTPVVPQVNAQLYRPPVDARATLWTESAGGLVDDFYAAPVLGLSYVHKPFVFLSDDGEVTALVSDALQANAVLVTAYDRVRAAVDIPLYLYSAGDLTADGAGVGDVGAELRVTAVDPAESPLGLALLGRLTVATGTVEAPLVDPDPSGEFAVAVEHRALEGDLVVAANLGTRIGPRAELANVVLDDQFLWKVGVGGQVGEGAGLSFDLGGRVSYASTDVAGLPIEAIAGASLRLTDEWVVRPGFGRGLTPGVGSPQARLLIVFAYDQAAPRDTDLDGLVDDVDECPMEPEDTDGFQDTDGCPDFSVQVGIQATDPAGEPIAQAVFVVRGPEAPFQGPGPALLDLHEGAYTVSATAAGFEPAEDSFSVAAAGSDVVVVMTPIVVPGAIGLEVLDEWGDPVATPRFTLDGESVTTFDGLPVAPGGHTVTVGGDGFRTVTLEFDVPEGGEVADVVVLSKPRVAITVARIEITDSIYFETASAVIRAESVDLMTEIGEALEAHVDVTKLRIEGHTDSRGSESYNLGLSKERAASVRDWLVDYGIAGDRIVSEGFGESKPVDDRNVPAAWEANRRVDFVILERD